MSLINPQVIRNWWFSVLLLGSILILNFVPENVHESLNLKHSPIDQGEWWRLYSCHLLHLSLNHTLLNFAGYSIVIFSFRDEIPPVREILILFICATGVGLGIYFLNPEMYSYVGLSGAIYGVLIAFVIIGLNKTPGLSILFLAFIIFKFSYEAINGSTSNETEKFIGGKVATDSHLYGALSGILPGIYFFLKDRKQLIKQSTLHFVNQFKHPIVRDLAWSLHSPPLLAINTNSFESISHEACIKIANDFLPKLKALDQNPTPIIKAIDSNILRLGLYFESLIKYWLENQSRYQLIAHGLTVYDGKKTLGEFDFIIKDTHTQETLHWETAVKFYLGIKDCNNTELWHGPGKKDRLDIKINHLTNKQIQLSHLKAAQNTLQENHIQIDRKQLFVKGRLFYPANIQTTPKTLKQQLATNHLKARWFTLDQLIAMKNTHALKLYPWQTPSFHVATKEEWITAHQAGSLSFVELKTALVDKNLQRPVIIIVSINKQEHSRFFVVPNDWPKELESN